MTVRGAPNHPATLPYVDAVGKLMQNFGLIEFQTHEWIGLLQTDAMVGELAKHTKLRDRIATIQKMIDRVDWLQPAVKAQFRDVWARVQPHAELRNIVAHAPVVMGFPDEDSSAPASVSGVLNLKPRDKSKDAELISVEEILGSVTETYVIGQKLLAGLALVRDARQRAT